MNCYYIIVVIFFISDFIMIPTLNIALLIQIIVILIFIAANSIFTFHLFCETAKQIGENYGEVGYYRGVLRTPSNT